MTAIDMEDIEKGRVLRDGERLVVSMTIMDGEQRAAAVTASAILRDAAQVPVRDALGRPAGNRPGYAFAADATGQSRVTAAYQAYERKLANAWRAPAALPGAPDAPRPTGDRLSDARAAYEHRLANAWRRP